MNPLRTSELRNYLDFNLFGDRSIKLRLLPVPVPSKNVVKIPAKTKNYLKISISYSFLEMYKSISLSINFVFSDNSWPPNFLPFDAAGTFFIFKLKTENNSKIINKINIS